MKSIVLFICLLSSTLAIRPHIISILQDDLGFYDSGIHNPTAKLWTRNITQLAETGVILNYHYSHWHCSPSRRSFITGRLPIHHGEQLSSNDSDDIDLRMTWISDKLTKQGYQTHWFGKYHTGFRSMNHLPIAHNFTKSTGSLQTGGDYSGTTHSTRWQGYHPILKDSEFANKPEGCDSGLDDQENKAQQCNTTSFYSNTILPCGNAITKISVQSALECCSKCTALSSCSHWVYSSTDTVNCHLKENYPNTGCQKIKHGSTSGVNTGHGPTPNDATCTNEYSTDLWGQLGK